MYKEFIKEKEFYGTLTDLMKEIAETFANEKIGQSKFGEFYNIAGVVKIEKSDDVTFNIGIDDVDDMDVVLKGGVIKDSVIAVMLPKFNHQYRELHIDGQIKMMRTVMLDEDIKATYTLGYS